MHPGTRWNGFAPIGTLHGPEAFLDSFWAPLRQAFPDLRRQCHILCGGPSRGKIDGGKDGRMCVGGTGLFHATFARDWLGIQATRKPVSIRWGEIYIVENGWINEMYTILDVVDLAQQAGVHLLPPSRGKDGIYPPPLNDDAVLLERQNETRTARTLDLIRRFIFEGLNVYDQASLESMGLANFFIPDIKWYGPGGIGACYGIDEFEQFHQRHWLTAFPDREVLDIDCLYAEGDYTGAAGWPDVIATNNGEYLGVPASGSRLEVIGLDYWRRDGDKFIENWVFVDMVHLFRQMGVDLMSRI